MLFEFTIMKWRMPIIFKTLKPVKMLIKTLLHIFPASTTSAMQYFNGKKRRLIIKIPVRNRINRFFRSG